MKRLLLLALLSSSACLPGPRSSEGRAQQDRLLEHFEGDGYVIDTPGGQIFAREGDRSQVTLRVNCPDFAFRVTRTDPALTQLSLKLFNFNPAQQLVATPGTLNVGGLPVTGVKDAQPLTANFVLRFPTGVNVAEIQSVAPLKSDFTFLAFGDIQTGIDRFGDVIAKVNAEPEADFILMLGDLTNSSDPEQFDAVEKAYARIRFPILATPGNHDAYDNFGYQNRFGRASWTCSHRGAQFTAIDSASAEVAPTTWNQLPQWWRAGEDKVHVMFSHIPVSDVTNARLGEWASRREARHFISESVKHGVDLFLFGHVHSYDKYEVSGISTFISGGCGATPEQLDGIGRHYLRARVKNGKLDSVEQVRVDPE